ncbi:MAG: peptidoglycan-associated lipoprotein Pal [Gammaproteobacteria bacterium]|nr:peptidoglycan-associated lipoprotein Pal [Gammaproteobacteria bacterium]MBL7001102.1 peptidoglycan-associated lipoprotein Pal [Gammaproteobacteria bacterium]
MSGCAVKDEDINNTVDQIRNGAQQQQDQNENTDSAAGVATPIAGSDTQASAFSEDSLSAQQLLDQVDSPIAARVIYFEFDSAKVTDDSLKLLEAHGDFIASQGNVNVTLSGHADERGSREYNIALGDRRAQSVRRILLFQGASSDQIESVSYGEEQPAVLGHDESAWSKNRRVELIYQLK